MSDTLLTGEDAFCEKIYCHTVKTNEEGRFIVQLPIKSNIINLGSTREIALRQFLLLEKHLNRNPELKQQYAKFMKEYEDLNHMELVNDDEVQKSGYHIPHHAVVRENSTTTKLRVVFDASCKSDANCSLNECLMVRPVVQEELFSIVLRFCSHIYVMIADIEKMYRQILVEPQQTQYQLIFWREDSSQPIKTYRFLTVTYGTASAPFLATRTLKQLALHSVNTFPKAAEVILTDFYVDDVLTGTNSISEALELQTQLIKCCKQGGFNLRKWRANNHQLIENLQPENCDSGHNYYITNDHTVKTLGIHWNSQNDTFQFTINTDIKDKNRVTKRTILSEVSKLFDPLGLVSPIILKAKVIIQDLWILKLSWDDSVPIHIHTKWIQFKHSLADLNQLQIPRCIISDFHIISLQLHTFSDASQVGYGACVYIRSE
ncbi:uncharacterized protein LOC142332439 [Lycorma delicatula]|uniref:uncharacterized protein LOC142332439 n=1 Tax=Lycorma delicatula TaxID=130591 RepID=UPI003F51958E